MSPLGILALILTAIIATVYLFRVNEPAVTRSVRLVDKLRWLIGLVFLGLAAYHLFRSGSPLMIALAMGGIAFLTGYILVERPWSEVI